MIALFYLLEEIRVAFLILWIEKQMYATELVSGGLGLEPHLGV